MIKETWWLNNYKVYNQKGRWLAKFALRSDAEAFLRYYVREWTQIRDEHWYKMWTTPFHKPELL